ncbi:20710_t:CDS:2, partial [Gigaspora margarita]
QKCLVLERDKIVAEYLGIAHPETVWLIRRLSEKNMNREATSSINKREVEIISNKKEKSKKTYNEKIDCLDLVKNIQETSDKKKHKEELLLTECRVSDYVAGLAKYNNLTESIIKNVKQATALDKIEIDQNKEAKGISTNQCSSKESNKEDINRAETGKHKGSGIGVLVHKDLKRHIEKIERINSYILAVYFYLKGVKLLILMVYIPPSCADMIKNRRASERIPNSSDRNFNHIVNLALNKQLTAKIFKRLKLHTWLKLQNYTDTFRYLNRKSTKFMWSNKNAATRIDQIWISSNLKDKVTKVEIEEMETVKEVTTTWFLCN